MSLSSVLEDVANTPTAGSFIVKETDRDSRSGCVCSQEYDSEWSDGRGDFQWSCISVPGRDNCVNGSAILEDAPALRHSPRGVSVLSGVEIGVRQRCHCPRAYIRSIQGCTACAGTVREVSTQQGGATRLPMELVSFSGSSERAHAECWRWPGTRRSRRPDWGWARGFSKRGKVAPSAGGRLSRRPGFSPASDPYMSYIGTIQGYSGD